MSDEQKEILKMLSDSVISVEEAEKLLNALAAGQSDKKQHHHYGHHPRNHGFSRRAVHSAASTINETLSSIGPMVKEMVGDVTASFRGSDIPHSIPPDDHRYEQIICEDGEFPIEKNTTLHLINEKNHSGTLVVNSCEGETCKINTASAIGLRIHKSPVGPVIRWKEGMLSLSVPPGLAGLNAVTYDGDIEIEQLDCWLNVKAMGGDMDLANLRNGFNAKAMGGNIRILLNPNWDINSRVKAMGGDIDLIVPPGGGPTEIQAASTGGEISCDHNLGNTENHSTFAKKRVKMQLGEGEDKTILSLKSLGGNISIRKG